MENRDQILLALGEIKGQLGALLALGHERRIASLERSRALLVGAGFVAGGIAGTIINLITR